MKKSFITSGPKDIQQLTVRKVHFQYTLPVMNLDPERGQGVWIALDYHKCYTFL